MGMDLEPRNSEHPGLHYNWAGWRWLYTHLEEWGVDISEFDGMNDGCSISAKTCRAVADAIEAHLPELSEEDQKWLKGQLEPDGQDHVKLWRTMKGCRQF